MDEPLLREHLEKLIAQVSEEVKATNRRKGVTQTIASALKDLAEEDIQALAQAHVDCYRFVHEQRTLTGQYHNYVELKAWAIGEMLKHIGSKTVPYIDALLDVESSNIGYDNERTTRSLIDILGHGGQPAAKVLERIFFRLNSVYLVNAALDSMFAVGEPASDLIALALEHPEPTTFRRIIDKISPQKFHSSNISTNFATAISQSIIKKLIIRNGDLPNRFNDKITAECLNALIERNPNLRIALLGTLTDLAFHSDFEIHQRALQVAANLDRDDFLRRVRLQAEISPEIASNILYQLGHSAPLPTQQKSLEKYTGQLADLEKRTLARWDDMVHQSKINFWLRNSITFVYFLVSLAIIGLGIWLLLTADNAVTQGAGALASGLTTLGGMWTKFWKEPVQDIRKSFIQQAGIESTFIGFMTRTGQIRLMFEQDYAKGEMDIEKQEIYQKMIAEAQTQTAQELALIQSDGLTETQKA